MYVKILKKIFSECILHMLIGSILHLCNSQVPTQPSHYSQVCTVPAVCKLLHKMAKHNQALTRQRVARAELIASGETNREGQHCTPRSEELFPVIE